MDKIFTIFTPTYNRKDKLKRLYDNLLEQTYKDFTWLIIDDGSRDGTKEIIKDFIGLDVKYIYKSNAGKQRAYNDAIEIADTKYFICLDSDDYYTSDALYKIKKILDKSDEKIAGLAYLSKYENGDIIGTKFNVKRANHFDIYNKYKVTGDKGLCFKLEILKKYRFKVFENEKFTTEAYLYNKIARDYEMLCLNEYLEIKEYLENGLTSKYDKLLTSNPKGQALYYNDMFYHSKNIVIAARYIKFSLIARYSFFKILKDSNAKLCTILALPVGIYMYLKYKMKR
ncbi:glycosyltransferase family 2 protein [Caviibacter abscessus]|uniref:glycosyltransferase family 2 protein n=1 Tax=Caviibacter abscessus TaxID=1766719 RepID=UPI0009E70F25|nr:glycosyltransferase family 2 protein [Caviibacter abscessus]